MLIHRRCDWLVAREKQKSRIGLVLVFCISAFSPSFLLADDDKRSEDRRERGGAPAPDSSPLGGINVVAVHDRSSQQYDDNCLDCHAGVTTATSLAPGIEAAHPVMLSSTPGEDTEEKCVFCHRSVDLMQFSAGNLRRQVDVNLCSVCHGPSASSRQLYQTGFSGDDPDGTVLYDLVCSSCHRELRDSGESSIIVKWGREDVPIHIAAKGSEDLTILVSGEEKSFPTLVAETEKEDRLWILEDQDNPLVLKMQEEEADLLRTIDEVRRLEAF